MKLVLKDNGLLPAGVWDANWQEFTAVFYFNQHRKRLLKGLERGLPILFQNGCTEACIAGSF